MAVVSIDILISFISGAVFTGLLLFVPAPISDEVCLRSPRMIPPPPQAAVVDVNHSTTNWNTHSSTAVSTEYGLVCPSAFRDLADYIIDWPWHHFSESERVNPSVESLGPGSIFYGKTGSGTRIFCQSILPRFRKPFVYISGQGDGTSDEVCVEMLDHPLLIRWYAQNAVRSHPKLVSIPIGLNCFETGREMSVVLNNFTHTGRPKTLNQPIALAHFNIGSNAAIRARIWDALCEKGDRPWIHCILHNTDQNVRGNPKLILQYPEWAQYRFWFCPRGNGIDTHRLWEALYLGSIPIVEHSQLDVLYRDLPVLIVDDLKTVTEAHLRDFLLENRRYHTEKLDMDYWENRIRSDAKKSKWDIYAEWAQSVIDHPEHLNRTKIIRWKAMRFGWGNRVLAILSRFTLAQEFGWLLLIDCEDPAPLALFLNASNPYTWDWHAVNRRHNGMLDSMPVVHAGLHPKAVLQEIRNRGTVLLDDAQMSSNIGYSYTPCEWSEIMHWFAHPSEALANRIQWMAWHKAPGMRMSIHLRTNRVNGDSIPEKVSIEQQARMLIGLKELGLVSAYISADTEEAKNLSRSVFQYPRYRLFMHNERIVHTGSEKGADENRSVDDLVNSYLDWFLLGDADVISVTFKSTFSMSARMRVKECASQRTVCMKPLDDGKACVAVMGEYDVYDYDRNCECTRNESFM